MLYYLPYVEVTAPTVEPLTVSEVKRQSRVDFTDDDDILKILISAARRHVESCTRRAMTSTQYDAQASCFPWEGIQTMPIAPLIAVDSVTYYDTNNTQQTLDSSSYIVDTINSPGRLQILDTSTWPSTYDRVDAVTYRFTAGYGTTANDVPQSLRHAVSMLVAYWYENREAGVQSNMVPKEVPLGFESLIDQFKLPNT